MALLPEPRVCAEHDGYKEKIQKNWKSWMTHETVLNMIFELFKTINQTGENGLGIYQLGSTSTNSW